MKKFTSLVLIAAVLCAAATGCASLSEKAVKVSGYGAYASQTGTAAVGKVDVETIPENQAFMRAEYEEDVPLFAPTKTLRSWTFTWSGGVASNASPDKASAVLKALVDLCQRGATTNDVGTAKRGDK